MKLRLLQSMLATDGSGDRWIRQPMDQATDGIGAGFEGVTLAKTRLRLRVEAGRKP
jgi:hypothetical protein